MLVANRPGVGQLIADLRAGSDFAPPFTHLALWTLRVVTGGGELEPWIARAFMLLCVATAIAFTYHALRRHFARSAAALGALSVASHAMVVGYAFEVRFYAPWLMFAAMFAWSLGVATPRRRMILGAIAAIGLCTTHWFGVVTLGLMCLGALLCRPARIERVTPALAGIAALLLCFPVLISQRASVTERSWVQELSWAQFAHLANTFWLSLIPLLGLAIIGVSLAMQRTRRPALDVLRQVTHSPSVAALLALAAMPLALTVLSLLQPVMLDRYALTALLAWAPLIAVAASLLAPAARYAAGVVLLVVTLASLGGQVGIQRQLAQTVARDQQILREQCPRGTVAFTTRLQMYYHTDFIRRECPGARYVAISNEKLERLYRGPNERVQRQFRSENEFARMHGRLYGFPQVIGNAELDSLDHFVVMAEPSTVPRDQTGRELLSPIMFPAHHATALNGNGTLYERSR